MTINKQKKDTASQLGLLGKSVKIKKVYHSAKGNDYYLFESMNNEYIINSAVFFLDGRWELKFCGGN